MYLDEFVNWSNDKNLPSPSLSLRRLRVRLIEANVQRESEKEDRMLDLFSSLISLCLPRSSSLLLLLHDQRDLIDKHI